MDNTVPQKLESPEERITRLETIVALVPEMRDDLKTVLAYQNQQKGKATVLNLVYTGLIAILAGAIGGKIGH